MLRYSRTITFLVLSVLILSACNSKPDHRKYIPKDAAVVAGINLSSLSKKIAWNMITGSKIFKEMEKKVPKKNGSDVMSGIDKAGIDVLNTFYVYLKTDNRFNTGMKVTALVPLNDAAAWEAYLKKSFPQASISDHNKLKVTSLDGNMYMGWDKHLLIIMNVLTDNNADMASEMDNAFAITDDNSIKSNKSFEKLESAGHDLSMWVNYDQILSSYNDRMSPNMNGVALSKSMWKETAFACGFDFVKGKITGDMTYYTAKNLEGVYKEFGSANVNKDLISRMPAKDLDMMLAMHFSTKALKEMMDSTGVLGLANTGLSAQGTNVDNVLDAFTGDMAFTINDLSMSSTPASADVPFPTQNTNYCMSYVMKINKKSNFDQLMNFAKQAGLQPIGEGYMLPVSAHDSVFILSNNDYAVFSNKYPNASNILHGNNQGQTANSAMAANIDGHPFAMFIDIQETIKKIDLSAVMSPQDAGIFNESRNLLTNISFNGGEFKNGAMQAHMEINFTNKDESSILTLLDFGMRISDAMEKSRESQKAVMDTTNQAF